LFQSASRCLLLPAVTALGACGSDAMSLGSNEVAVEDSECLGGEIIGNVVASNQADVDRLAGCRELPGSLRVVTPADAPGSISLAPLAELRRVSGQLQLSGPITSLAGLESLEEVGVLHLRDAQVPDLLPLSNLTRVETPTDWRSSDILITNCDQLVNLWGLENLTAWGSLEITFSEGLVSLEGLTAPDRLDRVVLNEMPQLGDISALKPVRAVDDFYMWRTGVSHFDGFLLERADALTLIENDALTDLDGLRRLAALEDLLLVDNDALTRMDLPRLVEWENISVTQNDALLAVPRFNQSMSGANPVESSLEDGPRRFQRGLLEIGDNPSLSTIDLYNLLDIESVVIYRNASLVEASIASVSRTDSLWVQDNPVLQTFSIDLLQQVGSLTLRNNPAMSVAAFASVQAATVDISGNLDELEPAPATP
jgi:hypothetical protein